MYSKRIKIFIIISACLFLACLLRLIEIQLLPQSSLRYEIAQLKHQEGNYRQLQTVRGRILDRESRVLATDEPKFELHIKYTLTSFMDERIQKIKLLKAERKDNPDHALDKTKQELRKGLEDLLQIIDKCTYFGLDRIELENKIRNINDSIWNLRTHLAWKRNYPNQELVKAVPDVNERLLLISRVNIAEMYESWPLLELKTDDDIFTAQLEFMNAEGVEILPKAHRVYPYNSTACQTIGWVGPEQHRKLFASDGLASYQKDDLSGRRPGVEYVCETMLRGRRGEIFTDIDGQRVLFAKPQFGKDIKLTLDIELQQRIENYVSDCQLNQDNCRAPTAVVVINVEPDDITSGDILALVSLPVYDLNRIRYDYENIKADPNEPMINRAIYKQYPPGSVVKPLVLIAGLESGKITTQEIISCPARKAPDGWPSCWLYNSFGSCHDFKWANYARNAIKGSCNVYFSRLADRIGSLVLQRWLFNFGYGHKILYPPADVQNERFKRDFLQAQGQISDTFVKTEISDFNDVPAIKRSSERRFFGIGQGNLRVTPLQVANAMAAIARGGLYKPPRLSIDQQSVEQYKETDLNISQKTLDVVYDGMGAVVNEVGGTAYKEFEPVLDSFKQQDVRVYGKTGSTEAPENAWFAGFAKDSSGRGIAIAVIVEGGQHGSQDAAPLARDIIQFCIEEQYLGQMINESSQP